MLSMVLAMGATSRSFNPREAALTESWNREERSSIPVISDEIEEEAEEEEDEEEEEEDKDSLFCALNDGGHRLATARGPASFTSRFHTPSRCVASSVKKAAEEVADHCTRTMG